MPIPRNKALKVVLFAVVAIALAGLVVMALWNWLMPTLFAWPRITFWQATGLFLLSRILFGAFGGRGGSMRWRRRMMTQWERMTPEEREKFREILGRGPERGGPEKT
jgi:hypothetical protein